MNSRYGRKRIQQGLIYFLIGKGVSAVIGVFTILLVIRGLSVEAFAAYSVLIALVETLGAISGLGLAHILLRYVPELYSKQYQVSLRNLIYGSLGLRSIILLLAAFVAYLFAGKLAPYIGLSNAVPAFKVFLLVVVLRSTTQFLSQILESTLHQGLAQLGFSVATLARLLGMLYLLELGEVQLINVIWIEAISDALSLLVLLIGVIVVVHRKSKDDLHSTNDSNWVRIHLRVLAKFALASYIQHLAIMSYGQSTNRLVGGSLLDVSAMAAYGFVLSLYQYMQRYMPAQLLAGLIRPILVSRYCEHGDFSSAARMCEQALQINILLVVGVFAVFMVGGDEMLFAISAGKYGSETLPILAMLFLALLLETRRQQTELLVQMVERSHYLILPNVLLSSSVLLAILLLPSLGAVAFPTGNVIGLLVANALVQYKMKSVNFHFGHDWFFTCCLMVLGAITVFFGETAKQLEFSWYWATAATGLIYVVLVFFMSRKMVLNFMQVLTGSQV